METDQVSFFKPKCESKNKANDKQGIANDHNKSKIQNMMKNLSGSCPYRFIKSVVKCDLIRTWDLAQLVLGIFN